MEEPQKPQHSKLIYIFSYLCITVIFISLIEMVSFIIVRSLERHNVFFAPHIITQPYSEYLGERDPLMGWLPKEIDALGARKDPNEAHLTAPCVDVYGDSFTFGAEVLDFEAWPALLGEMLGCRVLNFGVNAFGTDQAFLRFLDQNNNSATVILGVYSENIVRNVNQFRNFIFKGSEFGFKPRFVVRNGSLELVPLPNIDITRIANFLNQPYDFLFHDFFVPEGQSGIQMSRFPYSLRVFRMFNQWHIRAKLAGLERHVPFYDASHPSEGANVMLTIIKEFKLTSEQRGVRGIVIFIPTCGDFSFYFKNGHFPFHHILVELSRSGVEYVNVGLAIVETVDKPSSLYLSCPGHFNAFGNDVMANVLFRTLKSSF